MVEKNLLVMRLSAMGDVAMTVPVIASFLKAYPDMGVIMLSAPRLSTLFEGMERVTFVPVDTKQAYKGPLGMAKLFKRLKKEYSFEKMVDLHDVLRSKILRNIVRITGKPVYVIDKGRTEKKQLISADNANKHQLKSSIQRYMDVFEQAGFPFKLQFDGLMPKEEELPTHIAKEIASTTTKRIAIAPFAQHQGKILPLEKTEAIIAHYASQGNIQILFFGGGKKETAVFDGWTAKYPNTISLAGKFTMHEELQILNQCDVLLSMDSANMHLASLVQTPVVSIWGATHPFAGFYGFGQDPNHAVQLDMPCRPCSIYGKEPCGRGDYACLRDIDNNLIINKIDCILNKK